MSSREDAWKRYCADMRNSGLGSDERNGRTAFMAGWKCRNNEPTDTDKKILELTTQVGKFIETLDLHYRIDQLEKKSTGE